MAPTDKEFANLKRDVGDLSVSIKSLESRGRWKWIRRHPAKTTLGVVALCAGLVTIGRVFYEHTSADFGHAVDGRIDAKLKQPIADIKTMRSDVSEIKGTLDTLKPLIDGLLLDRFKNAAALPQSEFQRRLPEIQNVILLARQRGVVVNPTLVLRMSEKLLNIKPRVPDF